MSEVTWWDPWNQLVKYWLAVCRGSYKTLWPPCNMYIKLNFKLIIICTCSYVYDNCLNGWYLSMKCFYSKSDVFVFFVNACEFVEVLNKVIQVLHCRDAQSFAQCTQSILQRKTQTNILLHVDGSACTLPHCMHMLRIADMQAFAHTCTHTHTHMHLFFLKWVHMLKLTYIQSQKEGDKCVFTAVGLWKLLAAFSESKIAGQTHSVTQTCVHTHSCMYTHAYTHSCTHTHTDTHTHWNLHMHTHTHEVEEDDNWYVCCCGIMH